LCGRLIVDADTTLSYAKRCHRFVMTALKGKTFDWMGNERHSFLSATVTQKGIALDSEFEKNSPTCLCSLCTHIISYLPFALTLFPSAQFTMVSTWSPSDW
jgi:hypothetical protein